MSEPEFDAEKHVAGVNAIVDIITHAAKDASNADVVAACFHFAAMLVISSGLGKEEFMGLASELFEQALAGRAVVSDDALRAITGCGWEPHAMSVSSVEGRVVALKKPVSMTSPRLMAESWEELADKVEAFEWRARLVRRLRLIGTGTGIGALAVSVPMAIYNFQHCRAGAVAFDVASGVIAAEVLVFLWATRRLR